MAEQLKAPEMGEGVEELTLVKWLKVEGDAVKELEAIVELETDKVTTEIPSPASGVILKLIAKEGATVKVGETLAWIGEVGEKIPAKGTPSKKGKKLKAEKTSTSPTTSKSLPEKVYISPVVKNLSAQHDVDLNLVTGSGIDGRITKNDVLSYIEMRNGRAAQEPASRKKVVGEVQPISSIRRTIAKRMVESVLTAPHVLTVVEADMSNVLMHRVTKKAVFAKDGVRLTLTAYFIAAIAEGLKMHPVANSSWTDEGLAMHADINIGMAVALGAEGLIVPVIKNADTLSLLGIAQQVNDLAQRARSKKLKPVEVRSATFSLTNHGTGGSLFATPIITLPQVGILGTGAMEKRAVVVTDKLGNDAIAIRPMIYLSFVFDHRVLDGESADAFLTTVKEKLEIWQ